LTDVEQGRSRESWGTTETSYLAVHIARIKGGSSRENIGFRQGPGNFIGNTKLGRKKCEDVLEGTLVCSYHS